MTCKWLASIGLQLTVKENGSDISDGKWQSPFFSICFLALGSSESKWSKAKTAGETAKRLVEGQSGESGEQQMRQCSALDLCHCHRPPDWLSVWHKAGQGDWNTDAQPHQWNIRGRIEQGNSLVSLSNKRQTHQTAQHCPHKGRRGSQEWRKAHVASELWACLSLPGLRG